jgi:hypothetical protein
VLERATRGSVVPYRCSQLTFFEPHGGPTLVEQSKTGTINSMSDEGKPVYPEINGQCHIGVHFGKLVEVYASPREYWCVVHHPEDPALTASWKMSIELLAHQAAALAAFKTEEEDYDLREWPVWPLGSFPPKAS